MMLLFLLLPFLDVVVQHYRMQDIMPKEHGQNQDLALCCALVEHNRGNFQPCGASV